MTHETAPRPEQSKGPHKKTIRDPHETLRLAVEAYPEGVVHSSGHKTKNAAVSAKKRVDYRKGLWVELDEYHLVAWVVEEPDKGTWAMVVGVEFPLDRGALD